MSRLVKTLAIVLAVPVIVSALATLGRARWESRWDPWLARRMATARVLPYSSVLVRPSLSSVCADRRTGSRFTPCATYGLFSAAIGGAAVVGGAGVAFLLGLLLGGRWCRGSQSRMIRLFRPALVATALGTACLGAVHVLLAVEGIVVGAAALWMKPVEWVSSPWLVAVGVVGAGWAVANTSAAFGLIRRPTISLVGQVLDLSEHERLADSLRAVSAMVDAEPPDHVVACLVPWLFVTGMNVTCLERRVSGRTLCLSLPLARILSVDEFRGQVAHDLAHYSRKRAAFTTRVASPLAGVSRAMHDAARRSRGIRAAVWEAPLALLSVFVDEVGAADILDGDHERAADTLAATVAGREAFGSGLVKLAAFTPAWRVVSTLMQSAAYADTQYVNVSAVFEEIAAANADDERLTGVELTAQAHPVDRHATLGERLASLGLQLREVAEAALATVPRPSAASLIEGCEAIEQRLSTAEHQLIVETGGRIPRA